MKEIIKAIKDISDGFINIIVFKESLILNDKIDIKNWPIVEALLAFSSDKFPLQKVKE